MKKTNNLPKKSAAPKGENRDPNRNIKAVTQCDILSSNAEMKDEF